MKREELKSLGLTDEQIDKVMAENGKDIEKSKSEVTAIATERDTLKTQLADAGKQIESFKGMKKPEEVDAAVAEWKTKAEQAATEAQAQVNQLKFDHALEGALTGAKVKDVVSVKAHLKSDALKLNEDGSILGLKEQLETLKTAKDFLFESDTETPQIITGATSKTVLTDAFDVALRQGAGIQPAK